ncbi:glycosyltransferase family 4 protein [Zunongwangia sp. H14]|uniref:glycosyltransferase family 4 protein n=1 Tax=Zunongwangia sp. H14 TaxID=3240792 RepID=UPI00356836D4
MNRILITGPFEDKGGRELEAGFIASELKKEFAVQVFSTANLSRESQLYSFDDNLKVDTLKQFIWQKYWLLRPFTFVSYIRNRKKNPIYYYVNNRFTSSLIKKNEKKVLDNIIKDYDLVLIFAHLHTLRTREIIEIAYAYNIPILFRTTGEIKEGLNLAHLKKVSIYIHHSYKNANKLHHSLIDNNFTIIDQTAMNEEELLKIKMQTTKPKNFTVLARLSPEKNIINLIRFFTKFSFPDDKLTIVGEGPLLPEIIQLTANYKNIIITGAIDNSKISKVYKESDCIIIPSITEAGPLVGIEAMAAGKLILSTEVGAMKERLKTTYNNFWFQADNEKSFGIEYKKIKILETNELLRIRERNRKVYLENYSKQKIIDKYIAEVKRNINE